jgi:hypothetical protein
MGCLAREVALDDTGVARCGYYMYGLRRFMAGQRLLKVWGCGPVWGRVCGPVWWVRVCVCVWVCVPCADLTPGLAESLVMLGGRGHAACAPRQRACCVNP